ncbi:MerR family transcriptional regulator [Flexivirga endophytica]|uniref:MerR family transcriptional regulator n=1 Tax=Flexivirga endophytica TaxID=1849103 RepID=A0A916T9F3_9MICO|nr:MerR family transcriptional regulator [Flexivirga endophytica]GGB36673.1 MerR family transcriptional regulator [Flexivirga endophytica]GHB44293.1 MerR family transcriptional regulator [Flexivirga endophytica]
MTDRSPGLSIGAVLTRLQEEFPDLTLSKVRFLDAQGLVSPERSSSGYRRYAERDVERLRFVLRCQRDKYWPLKVIAEALDAYERGLRPSEQSDGPQPPSPAVDPALAAAQEPEERSDAEVQLTRAELQRATGLDTRALADLESFGLVHTDDRDLYSGRDLQVAHAAATLLSYGIEARHLRPFRLAAEREVALVQGLTGMSHEVDAEELVRQCLELHLALVRADLSRG